MFDYFVSYALKSGVFCPNWGIFYGTLLGKKLGDFRNKKQEQRSMGYGYGLGTIDNGLSGVNQPFGFTQVNNNH
ncbi:hypothetical protein C943_01506 [Mariniradius saccharolyticus AK6]|uniref:Uncharacterized protein n=1 Tax=Mariniradius saccharolyticus AK6 TaxID=1239962 RepID=M7XCA4_9BACT|nr:hypothetical protein C943_01506 [Mariniradius saccharolyticus AK6]